MHIKEAFITLFSFLRQPSKRTLIRHAAHFYGKNGLEVGGPSSIFSLKGHFPVYLFARNVDGVNYSVQTVWEGRISEGKNYGYGGGRTGYQYIKEATDLTGVSNNSYDFVLSSHSLEHVANPLKALEEWKRVLKNNGELILILPDKRNTFDINRPYTSLAHLQDDYSKGTTEEDSTHFQETIELCVHDEAAANQGLDELRARVKDNFIHRCVHHHVFSNELISDMLKIAGFEVLYQQDVAPFHLVTIAKKIS